jgi:hypothetical protein
VEAGRHADLIALGGRYYELYTHQFSEERQESTLRGNDE